MQIRRMFSLSAHVETHVNTFISKSLKRPYLAIHIRTSGEARGRAISGGMTPSKCDPFVEDIIKAVMTARLSCT